MHWTLNIAVFNFALEKDASHNEGGSYGAIDGYSPGLAVDEDLETMARINVGPKGWIIVGEQTESYLKSWVEWWQVDIAKEMYIKTIHVTSPGEHRILLFFTFNFQC